MVRLKANTIFPFHTIQFYFNSTMVRLKDPIAQHCIHSTLFQFHYGTIKSIRIIYERVQRIYFNSTMVRLKVRKTVLLNINFRNFNSTMVRLKDSSLSILALRQAFQFHYGTIKRRMCVTSRAVMVYFNSTMVRLKGGCLWKTRVCPAVFQFHYGTIKRMPLIGKSHKWINFNSTMVRLKVGGDNGRIHLHGYFNSTMVRLKERNDLKKNFTSIISIPLWYD